MRELTEEEILEELSSTEAVEVSMIESAANEIGQLSGAATDKGFVEEEGDFEGTYCIELLDTTEADTARDLERLGYTEVDNDEADPIRGFVRGHLVAMVNTINNSVFVYVDYDDEADSELDELEFNDL